MPSGPEQAPGPAQARGLRARWSTASVGWRIGVPLVCALAGLLGVTSMINAQGTDLRGGRHTDLIGIVSDQRAKVQSLRRETRTLQREVDAMTSAVGGGKVEEERRQLARLEVPAGLRAMAGPGLTVTLNDAPRGQPGTEDIDPNLLVVHQQDIQAVVNALWAGGAEAVSLQGQRIISVTGIKCVGNTVVLQGVPYSPPYRIVAVGDAKAMYDALLASPEVRNYRDYVNPPYNLGWSLRSKERLEVPAYTAPLTLEYARVATK